MFKLKTSPLMVEAELLKGKFAFETRELSHALQFRFFDGAILNIFDTGKVQWQGLDTGTRQAVKPVLERLQQRYLH